MLEDNMVRQLMQSMDMMKKLHMHKMDIFGLSKGEFRMMMSILDSEKATGKCGVMVSDLSLQHDISKPAISQTVNILEKKGLVERCADESDRRVVRIQLTEKGHEVLAKAQIAMLQFVEKVVGKLGTEDTQTLIRLFNRLYQVLEEIYREQKDNGIQKI